MINRRLLIYGAPKAATGGTLTVGNVGGFYGYSDGTEGGTKCLTDVCYQM
nr:MAG TPA: hypothetical protein [Caudoviricetes sp.]